MATNILKDGRAVHMSIFVNKASADTWDELNWKLIGNFNVDEQAIASVHGELKKLMEPGHRQIGFNQEEE